MWPRTNNNSVYEVQVIYKVSFSLYELRPSSVIAQVIDGEVPGGLYDKLVLVDLREFYALDVLHRAEMIPF